MPFWAPLKSSLSTKLLNITVSSLCKAKQIPNAETAIVDGIRLGVLPDVVTYNTLIDAYCRFATLDHRRDHRAIRESVESKPQTSHLRQNLQPFLE